MDIAGSLYYWDLSINTVTAVLLVLVVGLSVDYAAHVAHAFMRATGSRKGVPLLFAYVSISFDSLCHNSSGALCMLYCVIAVERVQTTLSEIGPPVLNGGVSTLLAFVLLVFSKSYIFQTFLKVRLY